mmetsp:Transcript_10003/g.40558  ORF Transcript_10003/g.40558 Transcript_10003/m.40558 type:complete len:149 (+) Transcript_10003:1062-1508(+)
MFNVPSGTRCGRTTIDWSTLLFIAFRAANALARACGARKDEVSVPDGVDFDRKRASRANIRWRIGGVDYAAPTPAQLRAAGATRGDALILIPQPCNCDKFGLHFGSHRRHRVRCLDLVGSRRRGRAGRRGQLNAAQLGGGRSAPAATT